MLSKLIENKGVVMNKAIFSDKAPKAIGPYSHAVDLGDIIFTSGQLGIDEKGKLGDTVEEQTVNCLKNVKYVLEEGGYNMKQVVKTTVFISDMNNFSKINEIYGQFFVAPYPARSCVEVAKLPKNAMVEIEVIAKK